MKGDHFGSLLSTPAEPVHASAGNNGVGAKVPTPARVDETIAGGPPTTIWERVIALPIGGKVLLVSLAFLIFMRR